MLIFDFFLTFIMLKKTLIKLLFNNLLLFTFNLIFNIHHIHIIIIHNHSFFNFFVLKRSYN